MKELFEGDKSVGDRANDISKDKNPVDAFKDVFKYLRSEEVAKDPEEFAKVFAVMGELYKRVPVQQKESLNNEVGQVVDDTRKLADRIADRNVKTITSEERENIKITLAMAEEATKYSTKYNATIVGGVTVLSQFQERLPAIDKGVEVAREEREAMPDRDRQVRDFITGGNVKGLVDFFEQEANKSFQPSGTTIARIRGQIIPGANGKENEGQILEAARKLADRLPEGHDFKRFINSAQEEYEIRTGVKGKATGVEVGKDKQPIQINVEPIPLKVEVIETTIVQPQTAKIIPAIKPTPIVIENVVMPPVQTATIVKAPELPPRDPNIAREGTDKERQEALRKELAAIGEQTRRTAEEANKQPPVGDRRQQEEIARELGALNDPVHKQRFKDAIKKKMEPEPPKGKLTKEERDKQPLSKEAQKAKDEIEAARGKGNVKDRIQQLEEARKKELEPKPKLTKEERDKQPLSPEAQKAKDEIEAARGKGNVKDRVQQLKAGKLETETVIATHETAPLKIHTATLTSIPEPVKGTAKLVTLPQPVVQKATLIEPTVVQPQRAQTIERTPERTTSEGGEESWRSFKGKEAIAYQILKGAGLNESETQRILNAKGQPHYKAAMKLADDLLVGAGVVQDPTSKRQKAFSGTDEELAAKLKDVSPEALNAALKNQSERLVGQSALMRGSSNTSPSYDAYLKGSPDKAQEALTKGITNMEDEGKANEHQENLKNALKYLDPTRFQQIRRNMAHGIEDGIKKMSAPKPSIKGMAYTMGGMFIVAAIFFPPAMGPILMFGIAAVLATGIAQVLNSPVGQAIGKAIAAPIGMVADLVNGIGKGLAVLAAIPYALATGKPVGETIRQAANAFPPFGTFTKGALGMKVEGQDKAKEVKDLGNIAFDKDAITKGVGGPERRVEPPKPNVALSQEKAELLDKAIKYARDNPTATFADNPHLQGLTGEEKARMERAVQHGKDNPTATVNECYANTATAPVVNPTVPVLNPTVPVLNPTGPVLNPTGPVVNPPPVLNPTGPVVNPPMVMPTNLQDQIKEAALKRAEGQTVAEATKKPPVVDNPIVPPIDKVQRQKDIEALKLDPTVTGAIDKMKKQPSVSVVEDPGKKAKTGSKDDIDLGKKGKTEGLHTSKLKSEKTTGGAHTI